MIITIFDARNIQGYLFCSNRLAENIGASYLVAKALDVWPLEAALEAVPDKVNPAVVGRKPTSQGILSKGKFDIELIYSAGGNALFLVKDIETARKLALEYSRLLMEQAPGLEVVCHHHEITNDSFEIGEEIFNALKELAKIKPKCIPDVPALGFGVTELCASGAQEPALFRDPTSGGNDRLLGTSAFARIENRQAASEHLKDFLGSILPDDCDLPTEFDKMGRSAGEKSFIGVVHVDGNGTGKKIQEILSNGGGKTDNVDRIKQIREFSSKVESAGHRAVIQVVKKVITNWDPQEKRYAGSLEPSYENHKYLLPVRPLIFGGDDITFICDGRIALDLAAECLDAFGDNELGLTACAGVALVKTHYPFSRAYNAAEDLCQLAKRHRKENTLKCAVMDWQIIPGGPVTSMDRLRNEQYKAADGKGLTCRPYILSKSNKDERNWYGFRDNLLLKLKEESPWKEAHSRLKNLVRDLAQGENVTKRTLENWKIKGFEIPKYSSATLDSGFFTDRTPLIDALELLDFMVPLSK